MVPRLLWAGAIVCLAVAFTLALEPTKLEPKPQVVSVHFVSVHYGPHEKSGIHEHPGVILDNGAASLYR